MVAIIITVITMIVLTIIRTIIILMIVIRTIIILIIIIILYRHRPQTVWAEIYGLNSCKLCFLKMARCAISCSWLFCT